MRKAVIAAVLLVLLSFVLGGTVFRDQVAHAASAVLQVFVTNDSSHPVPVREQNTDANGNIKVHEQGTAMVSDGSTPSTHIFANSSLPEGGEVLISATVPSGKRFVANYLSANIISHNSGFELTAAVCSIDLQRNGEEFPEAGVAALVGAMSSIGSEWQASEPLSIVLDAGDQLFLSCNYTGSVEPSTNLTGLLSGSFVPAS